VRWQGKKQANGKPGFTVCHNKLQKYSLPAQNDLP